MNPISRCAALGNRLRHLLRTRPRHAPDALEFLESRIAPASLLGGTGNETAGSSAADAIGHIPSSISATHVWNGSVSSDWFNAANWTPNGVPGPTDAAVLNIASTIDLSAPATVAIFNESAGKISGAGSLSVQGGMDWSGGTLAVATTITNTAALTIDNPADVTLDGVTLTLNGPATWTGAGHLVFNGTAALLDSKTFTIATDASFAATGAGTKSIAVLSNGTFQKSSGAGTTNIPAGFTFTNSGTLYASSGALNFNGTFTQNSGSTTLQGGSIGTTGTLTFASGQLDGAGTIAGNLANTGATLQPGGAGATGTLAITGNYTQSGGATLAIEIAGANQADQLFVLGTATLGGSLSAAALGGYQAGASDSFDVVAAGTRTGTFTAVSTGTLSLTPQYTVTTARLAGTVTAYVWDGGAGTTDWFSPANWSPDGVPGPGTSALLDTAATITLNSPVTVANFTQTNGTLTGGAILSVSSNFLWSGGTESGTGTTEVQFGGAAQISGTATKTLSGRALNLFANTTWSGTGNIIFNSGIIRNEPGAFFEIQTDADLVDTDGAGTVATFTSTGTLYKSTGTLGTDATVLNGVFFNDFGPTVLLAGELRIAGGGVQSDVTIDIGSSAQLTLASTFAVSGSSQIADTGKLLIGNGGTLNTSSALALAGPFTLDFGGTLTGTGDVSLDGAASLTGGTMSGSGKTTVSATGTLDISGSNPATLSRPFVNDGTLNLDSSAVITFGGSFTQTGGTTNLSGAIQLSSTMNLQGGTLTGQGGITGNVLNSGATIQPSGFGNVGTIYITGDYTQTGGALEIDIGGTAEHQQYDQLNVSGTATFGGTLSATLFNGFTPAPGDTFKVLTHKTGTGSFATLNLPPSLTGTDLPTAYTLTNPALPNVVTTNLDVVDANDGITSFREAINYANNHPGFDTISFAIPGAGVHILSLASALPQITQTVFIDGYSQPGASANTLAAGDNAVLQIQLQDTGQVASGLEILGSDVTVRGLAITGFYHEGIAVRAFAANAVIAGNFIGLDPSGAAAGNAKSGILILGATGATIGGINPADRNIISGNLGSGVEISNFIPDDIIASGNTVEGNFIGLNPAGTGALANGGSGIVIHSGANHNVIGGTVSGARNVISGQGAQNGVVIDGAGSDANSVLGNFIGTNAAGTAALANFFGVVVSNGAQDTVIGGTAAGAGNLISGNSIAGVLIVGAGTTNNLVQSNTIGTNVTHTLALGNGIGVFLADTAGSNTVGGTTAGAGNLIAFNQTGILVDTASRSELLLGNSVQKNVDAQIDLGGDGATPNDGGTPPDTDTGANDLQNFPVISLHTIAGPLLLSSGSLASTPNTTFRIELFKQSAVDANGALLPTYLGALLETTDAQGIATFDLTGLLASGIATGDLIVTTATNVAGGAGTSEMSAPVPIVTLPLPTISVADAIILEGDTGTNTLTFTFTLDHAQTAAPVTVNFATSDFTAHAGSDYTAKSGLVTFAPGATQQTITIDIAGDTLAEARERFHLTLSDPTYATLTRDSVTGIIQDNDRHFTAAGSGHGGTLSVFQTTATGATSTASLQPFGASFKGGVRVAVGDINGDGVDDFVAGAGSGKNGRIEVFDGTTMLPFADTAHAAFTGLTAFPGYRGGVFVAVGDVNGDGFGDVIVSAGTGPSNMVKVFSGADGTLFTSFQAFSHGVGGVRVATGDVNGDGYADVVAGSGKGSAVNVFDIHDPLAAPVSLQSIASVFAKSYRGGVLVAAGDLADATHLGAFDGTDDLIVSAGQGRANVRILPDLSAADPQTILAYTRPFHGVRVATADVNSDGIADLVTAQGTGGSPRISVLSGLDFTKLFDFKLQPKGSDGVYVG